LIPKFLFTSDLKFLLDGFDVGERRQSSFVTETLDLVGRCGARKFEMVVPALAGIIEIRKHVGAVKNVARAVGIEHPFARDGEGGQRANGTRLVVPEQAAFTL